VKKFIFVILLSMSSSFAQEGSNTEKLLDKIVAVINNRVISLTEVDRMRETLEARKEISPVIYTEEKYNQKELLEIMIRSHIIRDKINAQGYIINDDAVESRIKMTEDRLGLKRSDLLQFLKGKGVTYEEYFEIIRETMEFNVFAQRIIAPLITVTEQEIKNES
jgi:peptidyl-prolyl cis-trans isomerase SurA